MAARSLSDRFNEKWLGEPNSGCWLWTEGVNTKGYGQFWFNGAGITAHRFSYELYIGPIPPGLHVLHKCDTPCCVNPDHLKLGTNQDNIDDKMARGRGPDFRGVKAPWAKLTEAQVRHIRQKEMSGQAYAVFYNVSPSLISSIQKGTRWQHVQ